MEPVRRFRDPIHGFIDVYADEMEVIQDLVFQRLRRIKQLSFADLVYHGAEHSRFGHVLGAMHLAGRALQRIKERCNTSVDDVDIMTARMAALLHDVGHRPFSHALDSLFDSRPDQSHEALSEALVLGRFAPMIEGGKGGVSPKRVAGLIRGRTDAGKPFLTQLISGQLDVDRMDYLLRDSHYAGVKYGIFDLDILMDSLVLAEGKLAVSSDGVMAVEQMILARHHMFGQVYHHKTKRAFEGMAKNVARPLIKDGVLEYPSPQSLKCESDLLVEMDDAWLMRKISSAKDAATAGIAQDLLKRRPFTEICKYDPFSPEYGLREDQLARFFSVKEHVLANLQSAGLEPRDLMLDASSVLPYKLLPYSETDDAAGILIYDLKSGHSELIEQRSAMVRSIARSFTVHRMFVRQQKAHALKEYLALNSNSSGAR